MIKINNISKSYNEAPALQNIELRINKNELFGLIGPDGAGKTTLMRILTTLLLPGSGSITMAGLDAVTDFKEIRKIVGYMPGRFSLYQDLTVEENLNFFASVFGTTVKDNYDLIHDIYCQIEPFKTRRAGKLSGGMKQKLALSCALIHKPEILVLDEPTTGVDTVSRKEFWEMLKVLQHKGITILVSTPYMDEAVLCNRVALMQKGEIMNVDTPQNITDKFPHKIIRVRSDDMFRLINDLRAYEKAKSAFAFGQYAHFIGINDAVSPKDLLKYLKGKNHRDIEANFIPAKIEDVFMDMTAPPNLPQNRKNKSAPKKE